jgi:hypothetical protein
MGVASAAAVVKTIDFLKDSAMVAIDAQETFGKFDVVFQGMGSAAETAAKQFQDSFGLAEVTAKSMLSATGDLLSGLGMTGDAALDMSVQVNTLASDLASFTNFSGGAEGASAALTKALLGERESVKALGIVIREEDVQQRLAAAGKDKLTGAALLQAKAEATLKIALEQSKNAIGDYERTSDSAANTLKRAKEASLDLQVALGTSLSPSVALLGELWGAVATKLAEVINERNRLKEAVEAEGTEADTTELKIIRLQREREELEANVAVYRQYDIDGKLIRSQALADAEKELQANNDAIKGLQLRLQYETQAANQRAQAQAAVAKWSSEQEEIDTAELDRINEIAAQKKAINDEFLQESAKQFWLTENGLQSEAAERENVKKAVEQQINALYALSQATGDSSIVNSEAMKNALLLLKELEGEMATSGDNVKTFLDRIKEDYVGVITEITNSLGGLYSALADKQISELDREMKARLEAEGIIESEKSASLQRQYDEAVKNGDLETAEKLKTEIKRAKIEEEYEKKKADVKYRAEKAMWQLSLMQTIAESARAIAVAVGSAPWPYNLPAVAYASAMTGLQLATIKASEPQPPSLATGGIAEPANGGAVVRVAENDAAEVMFNTGESGQAFISQMGAAIAREFDMTAVFQVNDEKLAEVVVKPINDGKVRMIK